MLYKKFYDCDKLFRLGCYNSTYIEKKGVNFRFIGVWSECAALDLIHVWYFLIRLKLFIGLVVLNSGTFLFTTICEDFYIFLSALSAKLAPTHAILEGTFIGFLSNMPKVRKYMEATKVKGAEHLFTFRPAVLVLLFRFETVEEQKLFVEAKVHGMPLICFSNSEMVPRLAIHCIPSDNPTYPNLCYWSYILFWLLQPKHFWR
jgi:hypothetical protein